MSKIPETSDISKTIQTVRAEFTHALAQASQDNQASKNDQIEQLEQIRINFLGRNGSITELTKLMKDLSPDEKRIFGPQIQELKQFAHDAHAHAVTEHARLQEQAEQNQHKQFDVTAYTPEAVQGSLHVYTRIIDEISSILIRMGYARVKGPEVEQEYYNFEALNIPKDHPARDMQDTFWLTIPGMLLRTQTSAVQARAMQEFGAPLAIFAPGRVYRHEQTDASHDSVFTQIECMLIDTDISMGNLLATAQTFLRAIFDRSDLKIRVRPSYFPFVEPGIEVDISCPFCSKGCSVCKKTTWIELGGGGLVHPNVLRAGNIDPTKYAGFAFGLGIERLAMIKYGINDIRLFHSDKIGFLEQF